MAMFPWYCGNDSHSSFFNKELSVNQRSPAVVLLSLNFSNITQNADSSLQSLLIQMICHQSYPLRSKLALIYNTLSHY